MAQNLVSATLTEETKKQILEKLRYSKVSPGYSEVSSRYLRVTLRYSEISPRYSCIHLPLNKQKNTENHIPCSRSLMCRHLFLQLFVHPLNHPGR